MILDFDKQELWYFKNNYYHFRFKLQNVPPKLYLTITLRRLNRVTLVHESPSKILQQLHFPDKKVWKQHENVHLTE